MNEVGHKDYTIQPEEFKGLLPSTHAITVSDYFKDKLSVNDVQGKLRINGKKVSKSVLTTVYSHIKEVEITVINILNGTSLIYNPPLEQLPVTDPDTGEQLVDIETGELMFEDGDPLWDAPEIPTTYEQLLQVLMQVIMLDSGNYANVYDATFEELSTQIIHIVDNIISCQVSNGEGTFNDLYTAITGK